MYFFKKGTENRLLTTRNYETTFQLWETRMSWIERYGNWITLLASSGRCFIGLSAFFYARDAFRRRSADWWPVKTSPRSRCGGMKAHVYWQIPRNRCRRGWSAFEDSGVTLFHFLLFTSDSRVRLVWYTKVYVTFINFSSVRSWKVWIATDRWPQSRWIS